jgi:uncharacterized RDD family membrane protein YckC
MSQSATDADGSRPGATGTEQTVVGRRIVATLIDSVIVFAILYAGMVTFGGLGLQHRASLAPAVIIGFYLWYVFSVLGFAPLLVLHDYSAYWFVVGVGLWAAYATVFEATLSATPGKLVTGIVVIAENGDRVGLRGVAVRNILRVVDSIGFYFVGFVALSLSSRRQRLGDRAGNTAVVRRKER